MSSIKVTDASFQEEVINASQPVLVDFWAEWCGPCRAIGPALEDISEELGNRLKVAKVNVDENSAIPAQFGVRSIPTLVILQNGSVLGSKVGAAPKAELRQWISSVIDAD